MVQTIFLANYPSYWNYSPHLRKSPHSEYSLFAQKSSFQLCFSFLTNHKQCCDVNTAHVIDTSTFLVKPPVKNFQTNQAQNKAAQQFLDVVLVGILYKHNGRVQYLLLFTSAIRTFSEILIVQTRWRCPVRTFKMAAVIIFLLRGNVLFLLYIIYNPLFLKPVLVFLQLFCFFFVTESTLGEKKN